jgi:hypothetical protein
LTKPFEIDQRVVVHYVDCNDRETKIPGRLLSFNRTHAAVKLDGVGVVVAEIDAVTHLEMEQAA